MSAESSDQTTGRTPWDFATAVLMRLGPTTVVVIGLLGFAYFLYSEINKVRLEADQQLQNSLASAQAQLVENTKKMGDMSEKLITNISSMLELSKKVDTDIGERRDRYQKQLKTIRNELESSTKALQESRRKAEVTQAEIARLTENIENLANTRKELSVEVTRLKDEKKELERSTQDYARQVGELKERQTTTLGDIVDRIKKDREAEETVRRLLINFANEAKSAQMRESMSELIGLRAGILEKEIERDGAGFSAWFYIKNLKSGSKNIFGYVDQGPEGPRDFLKIAVAKDRIYLVNMWAADFLLKIPTAENWYQSWLCNIGIRYDDGIDESCYNMDMNRWDQISIIVDRYPRGTFEHGIIFGEVPSFDIITKNDFQKKFARQYDQWSRQRDAYGRPALILSMLEREENFDAAKIDGISRVAFPEGLSDIVVQVLNASVRDDTSFLKNMVGPYVSRDDLGTIAAMALRDGFRVEAVAKRESATQQAPSPEAFEVQFSLDAISAAKGRDEANVIFVRTGDGWRLSDVTPPF